MQDSRQNGPIKFGINYISHQKATNGLKVAYCDQS